MIYLSSLAQATYPGFLSGDRYWFLVSASLVSGVTMVSALLNNYIRSQK
jgi:hypothetical protein